MKDPQLIQKIDFEDYRDISANIGDERLTPWILEAQGIEMQNFLGPELYLEMVSDWDDVNKVFTTQKFKDLWEGVDVAGKYRFYGLKPSIIYFAYARFLKNQDVVVTRYGVKNLVREESEKNPDTSTSIKYKAAEQMAIQFQDRAAVYLQDNETDFASWPYYTTNENQKNPYHLVNRSNYKYL